MVGVCDLGRFTCAGALTRLTDVWFQAKSRALALLSCALESSPTRERARQEAWEAAPLLREGTTEKEWSGRVSKNILSEWVCDGLRFCYFLVGAVG